MTPTRSSKAGQTLGEIIDLNAERFPDVAAYRLGSQVITHAELRRRAVGIAEAMAAAGARRQDRVAVVSRNCIELGILLAATQLSGVILVPLSFRLTQPELADALRRTRPALLFCDEEFAVIAAQAAADIDSLRRVVCFGNVVGAALVSLAEFCANGTGELPFEGRPDDISCLLFTSGTTGAAKCAMIGQRELANLAWSMNAEMRTNSSDRTLINMPMSHIGAIGIIGGAQARAGTVVLQRQFDAGAAADLIGEMKVTVLHLAPVMLDSLLERADGMVLESVHTVVCSAAPMTPAALGGARAILPNAALLNMYGQTETMVSCVAREMSCTATTDGGPAVNSVGFPMPGVRVRIVDDDANDVDPGQIGEILVQSTAMFRGYWGDPGATLDTLRDGWCHTGDIGRIDGRGLLYLVDRKKDIIVTGGENVFSPEVEAAVRSVDGISKCAVVGLPDRRWGETVCAVVVPRPGATPPTLEAVQRVVRQTLAGYKVPRRLVIANQLPLLATGKVDKKRLRAGLTSL